MVQFLANGQRDYQRTAVAVFIKCYKGYMSVSENDHLRENLFELCREMRAQAPRLQNVISPEERDALRLAGESVAAASLLYT
ncbi:hypothetical protein KAM622c_34270 [Klebsiella quasipneumoniae subsp. quasipneumoniae]|nr:hypothetical protein KAM622c_34270 [Klebsiella quasipneumoniae subsp. quasipneumoniae]